MPSCTCTRGRVPRASPGRSGTCCFFAVTAYGVDFADQPQTRRAALATAIGATTTAAGSISVLQLVAGDALLPAFRRARKRGDPRSAATVLCSDLAGVRRTCDGARPGDRGGGGERSH